MTMTELTPSQTVGPFYAIGLTWPSNELVSRDAPGAFELTGRLLDGRGEDGRAREPARRPPSRGVDGLSPTRGEHHLARRRAEQFRNLQARRLQRVADAAAFLVEPARVRRGLGHPAQDRGQGFGPRRRGAGVIEIGTCQRGCSGRSGTGSVALGARREYDRQGLL